MRSETPDGRRGTSTSPPGVSSCNADETLFTAADDALLTMEVAACNALPVDDMR